MFSRFEAALSLQKSHKKSSKDAHPETSSEAALCWSHPLQQRIPKAPGHHVSLGFFYLEQLLSLSSPVVNCKKRNHVTHPIQSSWVPLLPNSPPLMAPHSSTLSWKIPWMEEPGRLQSMGSLRVGHDSVTSLSLFTFMHWRRKWQPTPVFLPGESQGQWSLVGCRLWGCTESDTTEAA